MSEPTDTTDTTEAAVVDPTLPPPPPPTPEDSGQDGTSPEPPALDPEPPKAEDPPAESDAPKPYNPELKRGDNSGYVRKAQTWLRRVSGDCDVTGIFDRRFEGKLTQFQLAHDLDSSGHVDEATWSKLRELMDQL